MPLIYKKKKVTHVEVEAFCCDRCKATYDFEDKFMEFQELFHWTNTGGYASVWGDGTTVEVTLCQKCTYELFKDFAVTKDN